MIKVQRERAGPGVANGACCGGDVVDGGGVHGMVCCSSGHGDRCSQIALPLGRWRVRRKDGRLSFDRVRAPNPFQRLDRLLNMDDDMADEPSGRDHVPVLLQQQLKSFSAVH